MQSVMRVGQLVMRGSVGPVFIMYVEVGLTDKRGRITKGCPGADPGAAA